MNRNFVIFDIHGMNNMFQDVLKQSNFDFNEDRLISMGDLGDRGADTHGVLETFLKIKNKVMILGNHDVELLKFLTGDICADWWMDEGGIYTLLSYELANYQNKDKHIELLKSQVPYFIEDNTCYVHAGLNRKIPIKEQAIDDLIYDRQLAFDMVNCNSFLDNVDGFERIFIGHTPTINWFKTVPLVGRLPVEQPIIKGGVILGDTGAGKGGPLTLMNIDTQEIFQSFM